MRNIMFLLFVLISGFTLGVALFSIPLRYILWRKTKQRVHVWHLVLKSGISTLVGLFLFLVIPHHRIDPSGIVWTYFAALIAIGLGGAGLAGAAMRALLDTEEIEHEEQRRREAACE